MALRKCSDCGEMISTKAKACPKCGAPPPKPSPLGGCLVLVIGAIILAYVFSSRSGPSESKPAPVAAKPAPVAAKPARSPDSQVPAEQPSGLSEDQRKKVYRLAFEAEEAANRRARLERPANLPSNLAEGQIVQLRSDIPLMPELDPDDPQEAIQRIRTLPVGAYIKVRRIADKRGTAWYQVDSVDAQKRKLGRGWINSTALLAQTVEDSRVQFQRQADRRDELNQIAVNEICGTFGITHDQFLAIRREGIEHNWPVRANRP